MFGRHRSPEQSWRAGRKLRVLLVIPSFRGGGAEKVICQLANRLNRERFEVHLVVVQNDGPLGQSLIKDVTQHYLECTRTSQAALPLVRLVRTLLPDVVLTAASHLNALCGMLRRAFPRYTHLIIRETGVLETSLATWRIGRAIKPLIAMAYRQADRIIGQSAFAVQEIRSQFRVDARRLVQIANPVEVDHVHPQLRDNTANPFGGWGPGPHVLCVGRLGPEKGFDRVIQAFPELRKNYPQAQLWILGEGRDRPALSAMARDRGVASCVHLPGFQLEIPRWMSHADLFVLSSRSESLPNVLLEAVACGTPVVALEQVGGTREVLECLGLRDRWLTSLVPWQESWFMRPEPGVRRRLVEQFRWQKIVTQYEELLGQVVEGQSVSVRTRAA